MSETPKVEEVVYGAERLLQRWAPRSSPSNQGQINKFIGDAILAVFQDPPAA